MEIDEHIISEYKYMIACGRVTHDDAVTILMLTHKVERDNVETAIKKGSTQ